jgi:hypothetical protein
VRVENAFFSYYKLCVKHGGLCSTTHCATRNATGTSGRQIAGDRGEKDQESRVETAGYFTEQKMNDFIKKALPWIGAAATGNVPALVAMAAGALSDATGIKVDPNQMAIAEAVNKATPEQLAQMKVADDDFKLKMQALGFQHIEEIERMAQADRSDARGREIKTGDSWTPRLLASVVVIGWITVQYFLLTHIIDPSMREMIARVLGTLDSALMLVLSYYFGSSAGSQAKNALLANPPQPPFSKVGL